MVIRAKPLLDAARDQSCVACGRKDGTIVAAHYTGIRSAAFGKGRGIKPHDLCVADLCSRCHAQFDSESDALSGFTDPYARKIDRSEQFLFMVIKTVLRRINQDMIRIKGYTPSDTEWLKQQIPEDSLMADMLSDHNES